MDNTLTPAQRATLAELSAALEAKMAKKGGLDAFMRDIAQVRRALADAGISEDYIRARVRAAQQR